MQICVFEDKKFANFEPLMFNRPVYDLVCGTFTLLEKIQFAFPGVNLNLHCREYLKNVTERRYPKVSVNIIPDDDCLFINGRIVADQSLSQQINLNNIKKKIFTKQDNLVAAFIPKEQIKNFRHLENGLFDISHFAGFEVQEVDVNIAEYIWDLIYLNGDELIKDINFRVSSFDKKNHISKVPNSVFLVNPDKIFIEENVTIKPGVVLDASDGPIYIEKNVKILSNAVIEGPFFIGESSIIKMGATLYKNVTISKVCKVGGEVEQSIFMPYSNKQHAGFIGHACLGSWVNLGADTNCSDLKNNYSKVKAILDGKEVNTGLQFLGLIIGDHSKSAINTMFNTGTIVGFSSNIYGAGFPDKYLPSFSWGGAEGLTTYDVNKAMQTAKIVTARRDVNFTEDDEKLFKEIFKLTMLQREQKGY